MINFRYILPASLRVRFYSSALYVTGDKAHQNFAVLTPHVDFDERLKNKNELEQNLKLRGKLINLEKYEKYWDFYKHLYENLLILDATKHSISENIKKLMQNSEENKDEIEKLKLHSKIAKDNYKNLRDYFYPVEENAMLYALSIPNVLDVRTSHEETLLYTYKEKPNEKSLNHFELGKNANLLEYVNPMFLFFKNDAALFEHAIINYMNDLFLQKGYTSIVNPSFSRSIIVEGCCTDYLNQNNIFTIHEEDSKHSISKLHFVGNSNIYSFMAYLTKFSIQPAYFPLKFFTSGKQHQPVKNDEKTLFNLSQYSVIDSISILKEDNAENMTLFSEIIDIVKEFYNFLGYHYKLVYYPANKLADYESLHLSIQMYSSHLETYIEVGYVSLCGNYLSKRLLVSYNENKIRKYPNIIFCQFVNIQKMLACILEYNDLTKQTLLTNQLKNYVPT